MTHATPNCPWQDAIKRILKGEKLVLEDAFEIVENGSRSGHVDAVLTP